MPAQAFEYGSTAVGCHNAVQPRVHVATNIMINNYDGFWCSLWRATLGDEYNDDDDGDVHGGTHLFNSLSPT